MSDDGYIDVAPDDYLEPGETATLDAEGTLVTVANAGDKWCAYEFQCPHQATALGGIPLVRNKMVQCPEHGSMFDIETGECLMASTDGWSGPLRIYPTRVVDGVVQVKVR
jgi:3-phenylpropionate/trans-cinnamate dioxygenase ferredoxin subunit